MTDFAEEIPVKSKKPPLRNKVLPAKLSESVEVQKGHCIDDETSKFFIRLNRHTYIHTCI